MAMAATAPQVDYQAPGVPDSQPVVKKRKRGAAADDASAVKRGDLAEVNGSISNENGLGDASTFADTNAQSNNAFAHNQESADANAAMAAALQAHGQQMSNYAGGMQQAGFEMGSPGQGTQQSYIDPQFNTHIAQTPNSQGGQLDSPTGTSGNKPAVGSEEWQRVRRDNHKEVERRRRETINEGINELAKIVPGNEKNKGSILARTVSYIRELQDNQTTSQGQRNLERQLLEQAIDELSHNNDDLKQRVNDLQAERDMYRSSVLRLVEKVREQGGNLQEEEDAGVLAKIEQAQN